MFPDVARRFFSFLFDISNLLKNLFFSHFFLAVNRLVCGLQSDCMRIAQTIEKSPTECREDNREHLKWLFCTVCTLPFVAVQGRIEYFELHESLCPCSLLVF